MLNGCAVSGASKRCDGTTWMISPAATYSFAAETIAMYPSRVWFDVIVESLIVTLFATSRNGGTAGRLSRSITSSIFTRAL
jgi:hypothetical protein